jgi:hypothetical protein
VICKVVSISIFPRDTGWQIQFFQHKRYVVAMGVSPDRIYGMDESGFPTGYMGKEWVVGACGTKTQHKQGGVSHQNITALVTIRRDRKMVVPPMIIFPGVNFQSSWNNGNTINTL